MELDNNFNNKLASFYINEVLPREKKTESRIPLNIISDLFLLEYNHSWPRSYIRKMLDYSFGIIRKNSTLEKDLENIIEIFKIQFKGIEK